MSSRAGVVPRRLPVARSARRRARARAPARALAAQACRCCPLPRTARRAARRGAARRAGARTAARGRRSSGRSRSRGSRRAGSSSSSSSRSRDAHGAPPGLGAEALAGRGDHRGGGVDRDHAPARQALEQRLGDRAPSRSRRRARLVAAQLQALEHLQAQRLHASRRCGRSWFRPIRSTGIRPYAITRRRAGELGDRLRELPALPGDRRAGGGPALLDEQLARRGCARA